MKQLIKYITGITIMLMASAGISSAQNIMTLEDCRNQAVKFNKELKKADLQSKEAKVNQEVARTAYLPEISGSMSLMHLSKEISYSTSGYFLPTAESEADALAGNYSGVSDVWSPGMSLSLNNVLLASGGVSTTQPIYVGGKIRNSNKQADVGVEITKYSYNLKYSQIIETTDQAFWNVAKVQENIKIAEEYIKMLTELEDQMSAMYEVGLQPASEKLKVSVQKNEAELNLSSRMSGGNIALGFYCTFII